jgi:hypothetical protein
MHNGKISLPPTRKKAIPAARYLKNVYNIQTDAGGFWRCDLRTDGTLSRRWIESAMTD